MHSILIVEDDPLMSGMYQDIFKEENYDVSIAADGEEGWNSAKKLKPSLILLDIMMPKLNGIQLLERLKQDPETSHIPVIMLTNLAGERDKESALQKGAVKYMIKSDYTPKEVTDTVGTVITTSSQAQTIGEEVAKQVSQTAASTPTEEEK